MRDSSLKFFFTLRLNFVDAYKLIRFVKYETRKSYAGSFIPLS